MRREGTGKREKKRREERKERVHPTGTQVTKQNMQNQNRHRTYMIDTKQREALPNRPPYVLPVGGLVPPGGRELGADNEALLRRPADAQLLLARAVAACAVQLRDPVLLEGFEDLLGGGLLVGEPERAGAAKDYLYWDWGWDRRGRRRHGFGLTLC